MRQKWLWLLTMLAFSLLACHPNLASSPLELTTQEIAPAQAVTPTPTPKAGTSANVDPRNWPKLDATPPVLPPPFRDKPFASVEEELTYRKEMEDKGLISKEAPLYGPHRKGDFTIIKGIKIKLPDDAYVDGFVFAVDPKPGKPMPDLPYYIIVRGKSSILVTVNSGKILKETTATGEENTFDFLKRALQ